MNSFEHTDVEVLRGSISLVEITSYTHVERATVIAMVDAGLLEPIGAAIEQWRFAVRDVRRLRAAKRLVEDLDVNLSGAAVILDLLDEREDLLRRLKELESLRDS